MLRSVFLYLSKQKKLEQLLLRCFLARKLARRFVPGENLADALEAAHSLKQRNTLATLNHLGENVHTLAEASAARDAYLALIEEMARRQLQANISVKLTQLGLDISVPDCLENARRLAQSAERTGNFVRLDMESSAYTDRTLAAIGELRQSGSPVGAVIQAYLYRSENDVRRLLLQGVRIRLCKGAYQEPPSLAFPRKKDVDQNYLRLMRMLLASGIYHGIATHDPRMIEETRRFARQQQLAADSFEFQMIYGVRRDLQDRLVKEGYPLRVYIPFGKEWFPYFMRRLAERPANALFALKAVLR